MDDPAASSLKRHTGLAVVPLVVMALGLVVAPVVVAGYPYHLRIVTMFDDGLSPFSAINIAAGLLALATWLAARRADPPRGHTVIAVAASCVALAPTVIAVAVYIEGGWWRDAEIFALPVVVSVGLVVGGLRRRGWTRALWLVGAFASSALPFSCPLVPGMFNEFSAGLVFVAADLTVLALFVLGVHRAAASTEISLANTT